MSRSRLYGSYMVALCMIATSHWWLPIWLFIGSFERDSGYVAQADLEPVVLLPQSPK